MQWVVFFQFASLLTANQTARAQFRIQFDPAAQIPIPIPTTQAGDFLSLLGVTLNSTLIPQATLQCYSPSWTFVTNGSVESDAALGVVFAVPPELPCPQFFFKAKKLNIPVKRTVPK